MSPQPPLDAGARINLAELRLQPELQGLHCRELGRDTLLVVLDKSARLAEPIDAMAPHVSDGLVCHLSLRALVAACILAPPLRANADDSQIL